MFVVFNSQQKNDIRTYDKIQKITTGQGDVYATGCLLDYPYFKEHYMIIAIDLSKQQAFDADPKAIQQINFTENLEMPGKTRISFIIEGVKKPFWTFHKEL